MRLNAGLEPLLAVLVVVGWFIVKAILNRREDAESWEEFGGPPAPRPHVPDRSQGTPPQVIQKPARHATTLPPVILLPQGGRQITRPVVTTTTAPPQPQATMVFEREGPTRAELAKLKQSEESYARAAKLQTSVADRLAAIDRQTTAHVPTTAKKRVTSQAATQLVRHFRQPATFRHALLASLVLGAPKSLEQPS